MAGATGLRQLALNNLVLLMQYGVGSLVPLLLVPHLVRQLGLSAFGGLAIALSIAGFGTVVIQYAFQLTGPYRLAHRLADTATVVVSRIMSAKLLLLGAVLACVLTGLVVAHAAGRPVNAGQVVVLLVIPVAAALHTGWHLQYEGRFATIGVVSIAGALTALAIGWAGVRSTDSFALVLAAAALCAAPLCVGLGTLLASAWLLRRREPAAVFSWHPPAAELREGWPLFASQFAAALYGASGPLVIGVLAGAAEAGAFGAVERVSGAIVSACLLTHTAAYPRLVRLFVPDRAAYLRLLGLVMLVYGAAASIIIITTMMFWDAMLYFLLGAEGAHHAPLLAAALAWVAVSIFGPIYTGYLTASNQQHRVLPLTLRVMSTSLLLGVPASAAFGAWAWLAALAASQTIVIVAAVRAWAAEIQAQKDVQRS